MATKACSTWSQPLGEGAESCGRNILKSQQEWDMEGENLHDGAERSGDGERRLWQEGQKEEGWPWADRGYDKESVKGNEKGKPEGKKARRQLTKIGEAW